MLGKRAPGFLLWQTKPFLLRNKQKFLHTVVWENTRAFILLNSFKQVWFLFKSVNEPKQSLDSITITPLQFFPHHEVLARNSLPLTLFLTSRSRQSRKAHLEGSTICPLPSHFAICTADFKGCFYFLKSRKRPAK